MPSTDRLMTVADVADLLQLSEHTVRDMARAHRIPHRRVGRHIRFSHDDVQRFIASTAVASSDEGAA